MLFFFNRVLLAAIIAFALPVLQFTFASPVPNLDVVLAESARQEITDFGLNRHHVKEIEKWHENHVIHEMKTNPTLKGKAHSAAINHTAHEGGSNPNEKNHITVIFYNRAGKVIKNSFNDGQLHHVYVPKGNPGLIKEGQKALKQANVALRRRTPRH